MINVHMKNILLLVFGAFIFNGCQNTASTITDNYLMNNLSEVIISNSEFKDLRSPHLIKSFGERLPVSVEFYDSLLYVVMAKSDTCIYIYNLENNKLEGAMGKLGYGPNDILSPNLIMNSNALKRQLGGVTYYDLNTKRVFLAKEKNKIIHIAKINDNMFPAKDISMGNRYWIGQKIIHNNESLCQIYDLMTDGMQAIEAYPKIKDIDNRVDRNYLYSSKITFNEKKNRIVLGMYFWDLIQIYNLSGNKIKTFSLVKNYDAESSMRRMFEEDDYVGFNQIYATEDYCYLRRVLTNGKSRRAEKMQIVKMDWDGNIITIYRLDDLMVGGFTVDEKNNIIIGIVQTVNEEIEEFYNIVSYKL